MPKRFELEPCWNTHLSVFGSNSSSKWDVYHPGITQNVLGIEKKKSDFLFPFNLKVKLILQISTVQINTSTYIGM